MSTSSKISGQTCYFCGKITLSEMRCGGCHMVWYCNKTCQKKSWKAGHKEECAQFKSQKKSKGKALLDANAYDRRGARYLGKRKWKKAEAEFRKALSILPPRVEGEPSIFFENRAKALNSIACALIQQGRKTEAEKTLRQSLQEWPQYYKSLFDLAQLFKMRGDIERCFSTLKEGITVDSTFKPMIDMFCGMVFEDVQTKMKTEPQRAVEVARDAVSLLPQNVKLRMVCSTALTMNMQFEEAKNEIEVALTIDPGNQSLLSTRAKLNKII